MILGKKDVMLIAGVADVHGILLMERESTYATNV
jgi:hypothetical protein